MILFNKFYVDWAIRTEVKEGRTFFYLPTRAGIEVPKTPALTGLSQSFPQYYGTTNKKARMAIFRN